MTDKRESPMSPAEYGAHLAAQRPPLTPEQVETIARTFVAITAERHTEAREPRA